MISGSRLRELQRWEQDKAAIYDLIAEKPRKNGDLRAFGSQSRVLRLLGDLRAESLVEHVWGDCGGWWQVA